MTRAKRGPLVWAIDAPAAPAPLWSEVMNDFGLAIFMMLLAISTRIEGKKDWGSIFEWCAVIALAVEAFA